MTEDQIAQLQRIEDKLDQLLAKNGKKKRATVIDVEFRERMVDEFSVLGGQMEVDHQIDMAMAHQGAAKYTDHQLYVKNWLKNSVKFQIERQPQPLAQASGARDDTAKYEAWQRGKADRLAFRTPIEEWSQKFNGCQKIENCT